MHCLLVLTLLGSVQIRVTRVQLPLYLFRLWSKQSGCQDTARGGSESWPPGPGHDGKRAFCVVYQDRPPPCMLLAGHRRCQRAAPLPAPAGTPHAYVAPGAGARSAARRVPVQRLGRTMRSPIDRSPWIRSIDRLQIYAARWLPRWSSSKTSRNNACLIEKGR